MSHKLCKKSEHLKHNVHTKFVLNFRHRKHARNHLLISMNSRLILCDLKSFAQINERIKTEAVNKKNLTTQESNVKCRTLNTRTQDNQSYHKITRSACFVSRRHHLLLLPVQCSLKLIRET
jgi:hypothetical protein